MIELNRIYNEDCLEGMNRIPDGSVDLVLTDPPYGISDFAWDTPVDTALFFNSVARMERCIK